MSPKPAMKSVNYLIRYINHGFKCTTFSFCKDNQILYSAKLKDNNIYIGEGNKIHIRDKEHHVAHIFRRDNKLNIIQIGDLQFQQYVPSGRPKHLSISVSFPLNNKEINWNPKTPKYDPIENKYYLNFHGQSGHTPIKSSKKYSFNKCPRSHNFYCPKSWISRL